MNTIIPREFLALELIALPISQLLDYAKNILLR